MSGSRRACLLPIVVALSVVSTLLGCGTDSAVDETRLRVVTSVAPITSIGRAIGGDRISLVGMVPQGVNSHTYEPPPSAARELSHADLVILNGLQLEEPLLRLARANLPGEGLILLLGDLVVKPDQWIYDFSFPETAGRPNPHVWTDPLLALRYAEEIEVTLSELDPPNAGYYAANLSYFREQVDALDEAIVTAVSTIPEGQRRLLTYHDSWPYFAMRYGFEVLGAVQPVDFADPSPREVAALIDQVRRTEVPAIFGSAVFRSTVLETIAEATGAQFVADLRDDSLPGTSGDVRHSYLGMMVENMQLMITALGGDAAALSTVNTREGPD